MEYLKHFASAVTMAFCVSLVSATTDYGLEGILQQKASQPMKANCVAPPFLEIGDTVALVSPSYFTPMENVYKTADVLRRWGFVPVIGANVGKTYAGSYAGTLEERMADLRWALNEPSVKAVICNRGGYGTIHMVDRMKPEELSSHPKWLVGFSDITTLHGMETCAGVMSIHGTMSSFLKNGGHDTTSTLLRDLLTGSVPRYEMPVHEQNRIGRGHGVLVGGNLCTFAPVLGSSADAMAFDDIILFVEEVGESMHNIDRLFNMLELQGVLKRCRGVVLGEFTGCNADLDYSSVEAMVRQYLERYDIPVACGMPSGHGDINLPLVMGAPVTLDVREDGATLVFDIKGRQRQVNTAGVSLEDDVVDDQ